MSFPSIIGATENVFLLIFNILLFENGEHMCKFCKYFQSLYMGYSLSLHMNGRNRQASFWQLAGSGTPKIKLSHRHLTVTPLDGTTYSPTRQRGLWLPLDRRF